MLLSYEIDEISSCPRIEHPCWGGSGAGYTTYSGPEGITPSKTVTTYLPFFRGNGLP